MKFLCVVSTLVFAMATSSAQANSAPRATSDAPTAATEESGVQGSNATASASGTWLMTWKNDKGDVRHAMLNIQQQGEALIGTANVQGGPIKGTFPLSGNLRGNRILFSVKVHWHHASFTRTVDGRKMSGNTNDGNPWLATHE